MKLIDFVFKTRMGMIWISMVMFFIGCFILLLFTERFSKLQLLGLITIFISYGFIGFTASNNEVQ